MAHFREIFGTILTLGFDIFVILFVYFMLAKQIPVLAVALFAILFGGVGIWATYKVGRFWFNKLFK